MGPLIAALWQFVQSKAGQLVLGAGGIAIGDAINIDMLRQQAVKLAPTSDPEALEEASRSVMRMLALDGSDVIFPPGGPKNWNYFHMDMRTGRSWFTRKYISAKGQRALLRSRTAAPSGVVAGGFRPTGNSGFRRRF